MFNQVLDILKAEITSYYTNEDLPTMWNESVLRGDIPRMASDSAARLKRRAGVNNIQVSDLILGLEQIETLAIQDFAKMVSNIYTPDWNKAENQAVLRFIISLISENLKS